MPVEGVSGLHFEAEFDVLAMNGEFLEEVQILIEHGEVANVGIGASCVAEGRPGGSRPGSLVPIGSSRRIARVEFPTRPTAITDLVGTLLGADVVAADLAIVQYDVYGPSAVVTLNSSEMPATDHLVGHAALVDP